LPDGFGRAAMAALRQDVDRRSRAAARPARPMSGPRSAQGAHRAASAAVALALAADAGRHRALRRTGSARRPHRGAAVCGTAEGVPPPARAIVGARALGPFARRRDALRSLRSFTRPATPDDDRSWDGLLAAPADDDHLDVAVALFDRII